jgi:general secretion pathway protein A
MFAQQEFLQKMKRQPNFLDRIAMGYVINPLNEEDTIGLINFRLKMAGLNSDKVLFTDKALKQIYINTQGFPRKINSLCHSSLIAMIRDNKKIVDEKLLLSLVREEVGWHV